MNLPVIEARYSIPVANSVVTPAYDVVMIK